MFIVTNRDVDDSKRGMAKFGDVPNRLGPNELRIVEASKTSRSWKINVLDDMCTQKMKDEVGIAEPGDVVCTEYVARKLQDSVAKQKRHVLLYVHGFNNDMQDVLEQADKLQKTYRMEVIAFSWPARGGGTIGGTLSYKRDKMTARASVGALDRTIGKIHKLLTRFNNELMKQAIETADERHPNNPLRRDAEIARLSETQCPFRVSALFHSMGNYLFKHALQSSIFESRQTVFDNVVLAAADANNDGHARWVDQINVRHRVYVAINENDFALRASRMKLGDAQKARLGHYTRELNAARATYIDFTDASGVGSAHSYFINDPVKNTAVKRFFRKAFQGKSAEADLWFHASENVYRLWGTE